ncbi:MAG: pre-peptidase C-terminal domain-containing protein, partial [Sulfurovum sp.]|nr:pre-peptidase C-terminal domain-containing protein [Sulfurovum sp.]
MPTTVKSPIRNNLVLEYIPSNASTITSDSTTKKVSKIGNSADWDTNHLYDLTQSTDTSKPTLELDSSSNENYVKFNGSNQYIWNGRVYVNGKTVDNKEYKGIVTNDKMTIYMLMETNVNNTAVFLGFNQGNTEFSSWYSLDMTHKMFFFHPPWTTSQTSSGVVAFEYADRDWVHRPQTSQTAAQTLNKKWIVKLEVNGTSKKMFINGVEHSYTNDYLMGTDASLWGRLTIGGMLGLTNTSKASLFALVAYNNVLSSDDDTKVTEWLESQYRSTILTAGTSVSGSISGSNDVKYYKFTPTESGTFTITASNSSSVTMELIDSNGMTSIATASAPTREISESVSARTYYVKVTSSASASYTITPTFSAGANDTDSTGNTSATAVTITSNTTTQGSISSSSDADWFKYVASTNGHLTVSVDGTANINAELFSSDGTTSLASQTSSSAIRLRDFITAGTYYIKVTGSNTANYTINPVLVVDDFGDVIADAELVDPNSSTAGHINVGGDADYFKIIIPSSGSLTVYTTGITDTEGILYNAQGTQVASDGDSGSTNNFRIVQTVAAGTYYVRIVNYRSNMGGDYTFISQFVPDDPGDTKDTAL